MLVRRHALLLHNYEQDLYGATNENTNTHKAAMIALRRNSASRLYAVAQMYAGLWYCTEWYNIGVSSLNCF